MYMAPEVVLQVRTGSKRTRKRKYDYPIYPVSIHVYATSQSYLMIVFIGG